MKIDENQLFGNNVFHFKKMRDIGNKLGGKKLEMIRVNQKQSTVQCLQSQNQSTVIRTQNPLPIDYCASYFQVQIIKTAQTDSISIGLISKNGENKTILGKAISSFGYFQGEIYLDTNRVSYQTVYQKLMVRDRIGIGINQYKRTFFVVRNGILLQDDINIPSNFNQFYPAVALSKQSEKVRFNFKSDTFQFKYNEYTKKIQEQMYQQIERKNYYTSNQIYSLVHDYLSFNNYTSTLSLRSLPLDLVNQKQTEYTKLEKYTKNTSITPTIHLKSKQNEFDEPLEIVLPQSSQDRQREQMLRKCSVISNQSQQKQQDKIQSSNEDYYFLDHHRIQIVDLIKQGKVEQALILMQMHIPDIFEEDFIQAYMKAHVFLQKIKEGSCQAALSYSKLQRQIFKIHYSTLCPFYSSIQSKIEWKPLKSIFLSMTFGTQSQKKLTQNCCDMLSEAQFTSFGLYINQLILNKMGYFSCSRLSYFCNHIKTIEKKMKQLQAMSCGIQLDF